MFAAGPSEQVCRFALDNNCHMPKKGHQVCKSCWSTADFHQKEMLKAIQEGYCTVVGCWEWASGGASVCNDHNALTMQAHVLTSETKNKVLQIVEAKQELRKKARQPDEHASESSEPSRKRQKSDDGGAMAKAARITSALQDLSFPELQILAENCIRELASRAAK